MRAFLYGATGLVGSHCLSLLAADPRYETIHVLARRPPKAADSPKVSLHLADFDTYIREGSPPAVDHVFCAVGTTIGQAGSQIAFRQVDFTFVVEIARMVQAAGARRMALVSALGANPRSWFFYNRVKGETEQAVAELEFEAVVLLRPSVIVGDRESPRPGELVAARLLTFAPRRFRPVDGRLIAESMIREISGPSGVRIIPSDEIV